MNKSASTCQFGCGYVFAGNPVKRNQTCDRILISFIKGCYYHCNKSVTGFPTQTITNFVDLNWFL